MMRDPRIEDGATSVARVLGGYMGAQIDILTALISTLHKNGALSLQDVEENIFGGLITIANDFYAANPIEEEDQDEEASDRRRMDALTVLIDGLRERLLAKTAQTDGTPADPLPPA